MNEAVTKTLEAWELRLTGESLRKLEIFSARLLEKNSVQNLVSGKDEPQLWERHILDSWRRAAAETAGWRALMPARLGAPPPPSAALEEFNFQLLDSRARRCDFLGWAAAEMGAANVAVYNRRVGEGGPGSGQRYAAVTERAMGQLENILPQCLNILSGGGVFLAWQSAAQLVRPRPAVDAALRKAGGELAETFPYRLPGGTEDRYILVFKKIA